MEPSSKPSTPEWKLETGGETSPSSTAEVKTPSASVVQKAGAAAAEVLNVGLAAWDPEGLNTFSGTATCAVRGEAAARIVLPEYEDFRGGGGGGEVA
jgi:hypothetical protein